MQRFLVEVPHEAEMIACARAVKLLLETGSHFMTHADFGCRDGDHRAWIIVEAENKDQARNMSPPLYRGPARVIGLNKFSIDEIDDLITRHS